LSRKWEKYPAPLSRYLGDVVKNVPRKTLIIHRLEKIWHSALGQSVAVHTAPHELKGRVLFIRADDPVWIAELTLHKDEILARLKEALGEDSLASMITSLRFINGRVEHARDVIPERPMTLLTPEDVEELSALTQDVTDEKLQKAVLHYLGVCKRRELTAKDK